MSDTSATPIPAIEEPTPPVVKTEVLSPTPAPSAPIGIGIVVVVAFFVSLITTSTVVVAYDYFLAQKVVTVDVKGYLIEQQGKFMSGQITEAQLKGAFDRLDAAVKSAPKNRVVLMGDAVIRGVETITIDGASSAKK